MLDIIFPVTCAGCGKPLERTVDVRLCPECLSTVKYNGFCCVLCGKPLPYGGAHCARCLRGGTRHSFVMARSPCLYKGVIKDLVHRLKYSGREYLGAVLAGFMADYLRENPGFPFERSDALVPVPLHWTRRFRRGYNQAEVLCSELAKLTGKPVLAGALKRGRRTRPQFSLSREDRLANISGAFRVPDERAVSGKTLVLVDDVCTTAGTLEECSAALVEAGCSKVYCLTAARG